MSCSATDAASSSSASPFGRVIVAIAGVYAAQGVVGGLTFQSAPAVLRAEGAPLGVIGLASLCMTPWALKFLWSPALERFRLPGGGRRRSRGIILGGQAIVAITLCALAVAGPSDHARLFFLLGLAALASATVDIACDAFAIEQLQPKSRGWGNAAQVGGAYCGFMLGGGAFLIIVSHAGWAWATFDMAALLLLAAAPFALTEERNQPEAIDVRHRPSLRFAWSRPEIRLGLLLTFLFESGVRLAQGMTSPFLIDAGVDLPTLGLLNGIGGVSAGVVGTFVGGALVRAFGPKPAVAIAAVGQAAALISLAIAATLAVRDHAALVCLAVIQTFVIAVGFVALYSLLMGLASLLQAGVDFTLFQCADAAIAGIFGALAGQVAQHVGYAGCFGLAALFGVAACISLPRLLPRLSKAEGVSS